MGWMGWENLSVIRNQHLGKSEKPNSQSPALPPNQRVHPALLGRAGHAPETSCQNLPWDGAYTVCNYLRKNLSGWDIQNQLWPWKPKSTNICLFLLLDTTLSYEVSKVLLLSVRALWSLGLKILPYSEDAVQTWLQQPVLILYECRNSKCATECGIIQHHCPYHTSLPFMMTWKQHKASQLFVLLCNPEYRRVRICSWMCIRKYSLNCRCFSTRNPLIACFCIYSTCNFSLAAGYPWAVVSAPCWPG